MPRFGGLENLVPEIAAYQQAQNFGQNQQMGQLQQLGAVQGILAQQQKQQMLQQSMQEQQAIKGVLSQTGGDPAKAVQALVAQGTPASLTLAEKLHSLLPKPGPVSIGAGGLMMPDGMIIPPAQRPNDKETWGEPFQMGGAWVQKSSNGQIRTAVTREPQVKIHQEAPVTPVTLQDPNDPNGTIVVDGRTQRVLGKGPKLTDAGKLENKRQFNMQGIGATIKQAEDLLTGASGKDLPTGSGLGAFVDSAAGMIGISPSGAAEAQSLKAIGGALTAKMPRMEGPQSDKDVQLYREMSAVVGDSTVPRPRRIEALNTVKELWVKYEKLNPEAFSGGASPQAIPDTPPPGAVRRRQ